MRTIILTTFIFLSLALLGQTRVIFDGSITSDTSISWKPQSVSNFANSIGVMTDSAGTVYIEVKLIGGGWGVANGSENSTITTASADSTYYISDSYFVYDSLRARITDVTGDVKILNSIKPRR